MDIYNNFTENSLPANATLHWTPVAAPYFLPWWTSVIGGVLDLFLACHNFLSIFRHKIIYQKPPHGIAKWNVFTPPGRHFTLAFISLAYTFLQTTFSLLHIAIEAHNISSIQRVSGGSYLNLLASLGTVQSPTVRTIPFLSFFAILNAILSITNFTLLSFLPHIGTTSFWEISSNACIADVCDATSPYCNFEVGGPGIFGLTSDTLTSATCVNTNKTVTSWGQGYGGSALSSIYTIFFVVTMGIILLIMVTGELYLKSKGDFTPTTLLATQHATTKTKYYHIPQIDNDKINQPGIEPTIHVESGHRPVVLKVNPWFTLSFYPILFGVVVSIVLASINWYNSYNVDNSTLQLIVTICPTVSDTAVNVPEADLPACASVGVVNSMTLGILESIKAKGAAIVLRLLAHL